ncbi:hypothetical protein K0M31_002381 [Melipona bicolor]|uniref:Uncharacterized protein n=1 Tax=Melipona bicolor TaxID=60889 RepID=A0AA40GHR9_9HYME|nr:hypothetical protein K0M31_002381 [Melipona bicolor]
MSVLYQTIPRTPCPEAKILKSEEGKRGGWRALIPRNKKRKRKKGRVGGLILENEQLAQLTPTRGDKRLATGVLGPGNETSLGRLFRGVSRPAH